MIHRTRLHRPTAWAVSNKVLSGTPRNREAHMPNDRALRPATPLALPVAEDFGKLPWSFDFSDSAANVFQDDIWRSLASFVRKLGGSNCPNSNDDCMRAYDRVCSADGDPPPFENCPCRPSCQMHIMTTSDLCTDAASGSALLHRSCVARAPLRRPIRPSSAYASGWRFTAGSQMSRPRRRQGDFALRVPMGLLLQLRLSRRHALGLGDPARRLRQATRCDAAHEARPSRRRGRVDSALANGLLPRAQPFQSGVRRARRTGRHFGEAPGRTNRHWTDNPPRPGLRSRDLPQLADARRRAPVDCRSVDL